MAIDENRPQKPHAGEDGWYRRDPTLIWAIIVGVAAAWIYVAPIAFNQGALIAVYRNSFFTWMVGYTPYPQLFDDRIALYASGIVSVVIAFITGLPLVVRRKLTWWSVVTLVLSTIFGFVLAQFWVPKYSWFWLGLAGVCVIGSALATGNQRVLGPLSRPAGRIANSATAAGVVALLAILNVFLIIPAASGAYIATRAPDMRDNRAYLLLFMKDSTSPLHEEIVELVAATTDYFVVQFSDKVPHPKQGGPTSLPPVEEAGTVSVNSFYFPMLVKRDSVDIILPSIDPDMLITEVRRMLSKLSPTSQPSFRTGRDGPAVKIWTEYQKADAPPSEPPVDDD